VPLNGRGLVEQELLRFLGLHPAERCRQIVRSAISHGSLAERLCPRWSPHSPVANIQSSGVISLRDETANGTTIWAVSCFNYGDDLTFNRQRYGPAWLVESRDEGATWAADAAPGLFTGRLAAPRFVQAGAGNDGAPDPAHVYALFPGTENNASFFECNDAAWLGRAPVASVMNRSAWEFYIGLDGAGDAQWDADDSIAVAVLDWPLHTSVQQVNWHAGIGRYVAANWVWLSADGYPRPDHSADERNDRTARMFVGRPAHRLAAVPAEPFRFGHNGIDHQSGQWVDLRHPRNLHQAAAEPTGRRHRPSDRRFFDLDRFGAGRLLLVVEVRPEHGLGGHRPHRRDRIHAEIVAAGRLGTDVDVLWFGCAHQSRYLGAGGAGAGPSTVSHRRYSVSHVPSLRIRSRVPLTNRTRPVLVRLMPIP
jgi:hypothetical protein